MEVDEPLCFERVEEMLWIAAEIVKLDGDAIGDIEQAAAAFGHEELATFDIAFEEVDMIDRVSAQEFVFVDRRCTAISGIMFEIAALLIGEDADECSTQLGTILEAVDRHRRRPFGAERCAGFNCNQPGSGVRRERLSREIAHIGTQVDDRAMIGHAQEAPTGVDVADPYLA